MVQHELQTVFEDREVTRLGESVFESGLISPEAMANTIQALKRFHKAVQLHGVDRARAVATSAMRDSRNSRAFRAWVRDETGWEVEVISGLEEGRLIHRGVVDWDTGTSGRCVLLDVGGGSCEVILSDRKRLEGMASLPLGAVRLTREFLQSDPPREEEIGRMKQFVARELRRAAKKVDVTGAKLVIATSGTAAALVAASAAMARAGKGKGKNGAKRDPNTASVREVRRLADKLTKLNNSERSGVDGIGTRRSEIIIAGAHVYAEVLEHYRLQGFRYSEFGMRDGILSQMLAEEDARTSAHQAFGRERWAGVLELARRYGADPKQMEPVRQHAAQLFLDLASVHGLPEEYRLWLEAAAVLRDVGKFLNYQGHHRHAQYIVANSELYGFTPQQRVVTSAIARYLGKSRPTPEGRTMRDVPPTEHEWVRRAVVLLRLAVGLNQDRASDVLKVKTHVYPKRVILELYPGRTGAELELWSLRKEADYFREVFRRDLLVTLP